MYFFQLLKKSYPIYDQTQGVGVCFHYFKDIGVPPF